MTLPVPPANAAAQEMDIPPPRLSRLRVVAEMLSAMVVFLALDGAIFHNGFYIAYVAPASYCGQMESRVEWARTKIPNEASQVFLLGDSRMAEGFSPRLADAACKGQGLTFFNAATPGATLRDNFYLLREIDPDANRFGVVAISLDDYDDSSNLEDLADRILDMRFVPGVLRYRDLIEFSSSFTRPENKSEAALGCLLRGYAFQQDIQDFLSAPRTRIDTVRYFRNSGYDAVYQYKGRDASLTGLEFDGRRFRFPPDLPAQQRKQLESRVAQYAHGGRSNGPYRQFWFGKIADRYAGSSTKLAVVQTPRAPITLPVRVRDTQSVQQFSKRPGVAVLDATTFEYLEQPRFFFDAIHLNATGRNEFTGRLAPKLAALFGGARLQEENPPAASPWTESPAGAFALNLDALDAHPTAVQGFYPRSQGLNYIQPACWFTLPSRRAGGKVRIEAFLPKSLDRLLPLTIAVTPPGGEPMLTVLDKAGAVRLEIDCAPLKGRHQADRVLIEVDKTLAPRDFQINEDQRQLSVGVEKIEFAPSSWMKQDARTFVLVLDSPLKPDQMGGFYERKNGLSLVRPEFWFEPPMGSAGQVVLSGYLPPTLSSLLPLTITAAQPGAAETSLVLQRTGGFDFVIPFAANGRRLTFRVNKSLIPKQANINADDRPLSIGVIKISCTILAGGE